MPNLDFSVVGAEPLLFAASPCLIFKLKIRETEGGNEDWKPSPIASVALRCQIRIEPTKRRYQAAEQDSLKELFGEPKRWGQTLRSMLWTHVTLNTPPFAGEILVDLPVPCTFDFNIAATKYFYALDDGTVPLCFLFSGTIYYSDDDGLLQIDQISWEKEANFQLPITVWKTMMEHYYPRSNWLNLHRDVFDRLARYKRRMGLPTWEQAMDTLLDSAESRAEAQEEIPS